jgi:hypothetical protein
VAARDSITAVLDYSKQPSFEVGTMGFWMATGQHPYGDHYPARMPARDDATAFPTMPSSWPPSYRHLMVACAALDPRDRPGIVEVAARLREMRTAAWMAAEDVVVLSRRLVAYYRSLPPSRGCSLLALPSLLLRRSSWYCRRIVKPR